MILTIFFLIIFFVVFIKEINKDNEYFDITPLIFVILIYLVVLFGGRYLLSSSYIVNDPDRVYFEYKSKFFNILSIKEDDDKFVLFGINEKGTYEEIILNKNNYGKIEISNDIDSIYPHIENYWVKLNVTPYKSKLFFNGKKTYKSEWEKNNLFLRKILPIKPKNNIVIILPNENIKNKYIKQKNK